jgi:hypothetical protein
MRTVFIIVSITVFLLFVGVNVYRTLYPSLWIVECRRFDDQGRLTSTARARIFDGLSVKRFVDEADKRGEKCTVLR